MKPIQKIGELFSKIRNSKIALVGLVAVLIGGMATGVVLYEYGTAHNVGVGGISGHNQPHTSFTVATNYVQSVNATGTAYSNTMTVTGNGSVSITLPNVTFSYTGGWAEYQVNITNTGNTDLTWANGSLPVNVYNYFVNSTGAFVNGTPINGFVSGNYTTNMSAFIANGDNLSAYLPYLSMSGYNTNYENDYGNFSNVGPLIMPNSSVTFDVFIGLGNDANPSNLPSQFYGIDLTLDAVVQ